MRLYPYFCYETGCGKQKNNLAFSIQSAMTSAGRVCLIVLTDARGSSSEGEYAADLVVNRMTSWFWEKGVFLAVGAYTKRSVYRNFMRELYQLNEELIMKGREKKTCFTVEMKVLLVREQYYYVWDIGNIPGVILKESRRKRRMEHLNSEYQYEQNVFLGMPVLPKIRFSHRRFTKETIFFLFSQTMEKFWSDDKIYSFLPVIREHEKLKIRMDEIGKRMEAKNMKDCCCICLVAKKE